MITSQGAVPQYTCPFCFPTFTPMGTYTRIPYTCYRCKGLQKGDFTCLPFWPLSLFSQCLIPSDSSQAVESVPAHCPKSFKFPKPTNPITRTFSLLVCWQERTPQLLNPKTLNSSTPKLLYPNFPKPCRRPHMKCRKRRSRVQKKLQRRLQRGGVYIGDIGTHLSNIRVLGRRVLGKMGYIGIMESKMETKMETTIVYWG